MCNMLIKSLTKIPFIEIHKLEEFSTNTFDLYSRLDNHLIIWFTNVEKDNSFFSVDFLEFQTTNQQATIIYPEQIIKTDLTDRKGYLIVIDNDIFFQINQRIGSDYLNGFYMNQFVSIKSKNAETLEKIIDLMLAEHTGENRVLLLESYLSVFLFYLSSYFDEDSKHTEYLDYSFFEKLMRLINMHFIKQRETTFYAQQFAISAKKINEICKKITNKSLKQLIQERIVLEIRKELQFGKKNIKEIAYDLGFTEPAYLTRFFKKQTGITPKEFSKP